MSLSIQTNVNSLMAQENLRVNSDFQARTIGRLTSGYRINSSSDDAAGLSVANKFRSDVSELQQGVRNANDGVSTLQIIDGGLNNISKMLDRMKTLATQSASGTFTGDRNILNKEYSALLTEIDRQASNVGLSTGAHGGRYNTNIDVYVGGGGSAQSNSKVSIALGGASNRADAAGLQLSGTSIAGGGATVIGTADIRAGGLLDNASGSQSFTFQIGKGNQSPFTVTAVVEGNASGISADDALGQLNDALNTHGIYASLSDNGYLQFTGDVAFVASSGTATGTAVATASTTISNSSQYVQTSDSWAADATEALTFKVGNQQVSVTPGAGATTRALAASAINDQTKALGIYAFDDGTNIVFQSAAEFSVSATTGTALAGGVFDDAAVDHTAVRSASGTATSSAESAITALTEAVTRLGSLQGTVGTAQNKLQYAVQLAQSQISNFSAAESRIRDADVAAEAANLTKAQVLQQASLAAMAQANSAPQAVLSLLRG